MLKRTVGILGLALALTGCGGSDKKASAAESAETAKVIGPMMSQFGSTASNSAGGAQNVATVRRVASLVANNVGPLDDAEGDPCASITEAFTSMDSDAGLTCVKNSCSYVAGQSLSIDVGCTSTATSTFTCDSSTYTAKNLVITFNISVSGSKSAMNVGFGLNLTGGSLAGTGDLACSVKADITPSSSNEIGASNLKCKYDGKTIDPEVLKSNYTSTSTCTETTQTLN